MTAALDLRRWLPPWIAADKGEGSMDGYDLTVKREQRGPVELVTVVGSVDVYTAPDLRAVLRDLLAQDRHWLVVGLDDCDFLDSTGLGVLVGALRRAHNAGGAVAIAAASSAIGRIFAVTGLVHVFTMAGTVDEAVAALTARAGAR